MKFEMSNKLLSLDLSFLPSFHSFLFPFFPYSLYFFSSQAKARPTFLHGIFSSRIVDWMTLPDYETSVLWICEIFRRVIGFPDEDGSYRSRTVKALKSKQEKPFPPSHQDPRLPDETFHLFWYFPIISIPTRRLYLQISNRKLLPVLFF